MNCYFSVAQFCPTLCAPWTAAQQVSLSFSVSRSLLKLTSIETVMPSNYHPVIPFSSCPQSFPTSGSFPIVDFLHYVAKYWSFNFSISPSNSGLISFKIDWFDLLAVQGTLKESSPAPQSESINSSVLSLLYSSTLTSIHDYWKNHSFDYTNLWWQTDAN